VAAPELTEDVLATDWTLSEADIATVIARCRGADHRLRFALQLCTLRATGRFLASYDQVPLKAVNYLTQQLECDPVLFVPEPTRPATEYEAREQIRHYLGYQPWTDAAEQALLAWAESAWCDELLSPAEQLRQAEEHLRAQHGVLPAPGQLRRLVARAANEGSQVLFERIAGQLTEAQREAIEKLLAVEDTHTYAALTEFKRSPAAPSAKQMRKLIERYERLQRLGIPALDLQGIEASRREHLAQLARCYDAHALRRLEPAAKRQALLACFLFEAAQTLLDHVIEMNDRLLTATERIARHRFEEKYRQVRRNARRGLNTAITTLEALLNEAQPQQVSLADFLAHRGEDTVRQAIDDCRSLQTFDERGLVAEIERHYRHLRKYTPHFFRLDFVATPSAARLWQAVRLLRELNEGQPATLPSNAPTAFIPAAWRAALYDEAGKLLRRTWELAVYFEVKRALRAGELYLPHSRRHREFWAMVSGPADVPAHPPAYAALPIPSRFDEVLHTLRQTFEASVALAQRNLAPDGFARITPGGEFKLRKDDALEIPPSVAVLKEQLAARIPLVRIERLLATVDRESALSQAFRPLAGHGARDEVPLSHLHAALIAHGTNIGLFGMGHSTDTVSVDQLRHASRWLIREPTLNAAIARLIAQHRRYPVSRVWGEGRRSSSDGQRFGIETSSLCAAYSPRYFGYYDKAVTIYTHLSDQYSVFSTQVISCHVREALYVLDGLLANTTELEPHFHSTDTHGYTDHLFGLCFLLGFSFQPRLADLPHQRLYKIAKADR
jgi:TnpA family transposase